MRLIKLILISIFYFYSLTVFAANNNAEALHLDWLDTNIKPSQNFFEYANGNWQKKNPIPAAYSRWGTFEVLQERNQKIIKNLLEKISEHPQQNKLGSIEQKVGDFYFSGMNETLINETGIKPLQPEFERINQIKTLADLQSVITHLQMLGVGVLFNFDQMQDFVNSNTVIGVAAQDGLGLPDRDYYLKENAKFKRIRQAYLVHIKHMFTLLGDTPGQAAIEATTVMNIETTLAKASMSRIAQRDPHSVYHMMDLKQLQQLTPQFSWSTYFKDIQHPEITRINLAMPNFFKTMNTELTQVSINDWKIYLRWHLIQSFSPYLSDAFVNENFQMSSVLTGAKELLPRWKRVINSENAGLGFAIGELYVKNNFPPASKQEAFIILNNIRNALKADLKTLTWMTPATRKAAILKLDTMEERVGYPDKWRDYSSLSIDRGPYVLNVIRVSEFLTKRELNKIGKPVDKTEWDMTPQEVNAYYDPSMNRLNIPAGILQAPFFDPNAPAAVNYGAIGFVMGHEMTHGFDDEGAQFDSHGNLNNWWTKEDLKKFKSITEYIANQFSRYTVDGNVHIQGKLVMGEATADLGGLTLAYRAFHASPAYKQANTIAGFTPDQQFFLGAAHVWAATIRPEEARRLAVTDPHPPAMYRVNGTLANMTSFAEAFKIPSDDDLMINKDKKPIW